jgi:7-cyano-7-deazaguanine synthase in queuosine biosynthesis
LNATDLASFTNFTIYLKYANKYSSLPLFNSRFPSKISIDKNSVPIGNTVTLQLFSLLLYGTPVQYVISGCNSADLSNASLTGSFFAPYQAITYYALASGLGKTPTISISGGNQVTFSIG